MKLEIVKNSYDVNLIEEAIQGNRLALSRLLVSASDSLRQYIDGKIDRRWLALLSVDDVLQETFADAFLSIRNLKISDASDFEKWLQRVARNNLLDAVKSLSAMKRGGPGRRTPNYSAEESAYDLIAQLSGSGTTPSMHVRKHEAAAIMAAALQQLPESYRAVIEKYDLEGQQAEDVAGLLQCSVGAMYMRRNRAHQLLRDLMGPESLF